MFRTLSVGKISIEAGKKSREGMSHPFKVQEHRTEEYLKSNNLLLLILVLDAVGSALVLSSQVELSLFSVFTINS